MKNTISWASSLALSTLVAVLPLASCQKETRLADQSTTPQTITRTIAAEAEAIESPAETKSVYEPGVGVHLTNSEYMSVYYGNGSSSTLAELLSGGTASPDNGKWTFSHSAISGATSYNYAFVMPHTSKNELLSKKTHKLRLFHVQYPTTTSFDPNMDFLLGQAQMGKAKATEINGIKFKRIFAPVKVEIYDDAGVLGSEKIHAVSFSIDKAATSTDALVGLAYVTPNSDYDKAALASFDNQNNTGLNASNAVTALNASGIEKKDGKWSVWYIMNPMEIPSGTNLTLTVTTDTKTVTRTVALTSAKAIERNSINGIKFDISGEGCSKVTSAYWDFSTLSNAAFSDFTASDNVSVLAASGCALYSDTAPSQFPGCLKTSNDESVITITPPEGKSISKVRVYTHPVIPFTKSQLTLSSGDTTIETKGATWMDVAATAGYVEFDVPAENATSALSIKRANGSNSWLSGITLFYK